MKLDIRSYNPRHGWNNDGPPQSAWTALIEISVTFMTNLRPASYINDFHPLRHHASVPELLGNAIRVDALNASPFLHASNYARRAAAPPSFYRPRFPLIWFGSNAEIWERKFRLTLRTCVSSLNSFPSHVHTSSL